MRELRRTGRAHRQHHGLITQTGGPALAAPTGAPGTVVVTRDGDEVARRSVNAGQEFRFTLSGGEYQLTGEGVDGGCIAADVTVTASADSPVSLVCQRK